MGEARLFETPNQTHLQNDSLKTTTPAGQTV